MNSLRIPLIKTAFPDLHWEEMSHYNVIEITSDQLTDASIRNAIAVAGTTTQDDLIDESRLDCGAVCGNRYW